jgi:putative MATE family efflux protein
LSEEESSRIDPLVRDAELEELEDPEASPSLPSATLVARAATAPAVDVSIEAADTYREIWRLAWPVVLAQLMVNLVSLIDVVMLGQISPYALAAVGFATQFFFLVQSVLLATSFACIALMARAIGAGDISRARRSLAASIEIGTVTALVLVVAILAAPRALLELLGATPEIIDATVPYMSLVLGSSALLSVSMILDSGMRANRNSRTPMLVAAVVAVVKLALNSLLIFGVLGIPRLELVGAGIATVVSQLVGVLLFIALVLRARPGSALALRRSDFAGARSERRAVVRLSLPGVAERLAMNLALLAYFRVVSEYGPIAIAAYTIGVRVLAFGWMPGIAFGAAAATLVGQELGAGRPESAMRVGWRSVRLAVGTAVVVGALFAVGRTELARLFTDDAALLAALVPFLLCASIAQPFLQAHFTLGGAHRGAGDTFTPFLASTVSNWALRVPLAVWVAYVLRADLVWVWAVILFDHVARSTWLAFSFRRGRWQHSTRATSQVARDS